MSRDIVATRLQEALAVYLTDTVRQLRESVNASGDWILLARADTTIIFSSPACAQLVGYSPKQLVGMRLVDVTHPEDSAVAMSLADALSDKSVRATYRLRHSNGGTVWAESLANPSGPGEAVVIVTRDVSERQESDERLRLAASRDPVTGLLNRRHTVDELDAAVARADRLDEGLAVVLLHIDGLKEVKDRDGDSAGDALLRQVGRRIIDNTRRGDVVGRYGGDEFVIISPFRAGGAASAAVGVHRVRRALAAPYDIESQPATVRVSVGQALWRVGRTADGLLTEADAAMSAAKAEHGA